MIEVTGKSKGLVVNAPSWFEQPEFLEWVSEPLNHVMTWHEHGAPPGPFSDVMVFVCPSLSGEGPDSSMPEKYWAEIMTVCRREFDPGECETLIPVQITNLDE